MNTQSGFRLFSSISIISQVLLTLVFNSLIAIMIYRLIDGASFSFNFIISQIIGFSIYSSLHLVYIIRYRINQKKNTSFTITFLSLLLGSTIGVFLVSLFIAFVSGITITDLLILHYDTFIQNFLIGLFFGSVIINYLMSRQHLSNTSNELQEYKISMLNNEKKAIESELKLLQSQIEPHFLFNTLSNIIGLIEKQPTRSKTMLESLTRYLRATLEYTRQESAVIEDELNMIIAYLDIFKERMGERLHYNIDVDSLLYQHPFPPMLLQPIVENAIKHGLEPSITGGSIHISGKLNNNKITLVVADTGNGITKESGSGIGLANVQQRLKALFANTASLELQESYAGGLRVTIEIPYEPIKQ